ncbi:MAG TPA: EAL domain-containing protein [Dissulfurispiraceae bacterium]
MVVTDLSERKRAEKALKQAYGELEAKVRERTAELALTNEKLQKEFVERKRIEEEVKHMAHHDSLTGLPNRRFFNDILNFRVAEMNRRRKKLAILFLDLDRFKEINDTLGHDAGDKLLVEIAGRLRASIRGSDTVARIGGDEFNIILSDIARVEDISSIAEKILDSCKEPIALAGHELRISTSIGISIYPDDSTGADELLKYADIAMYHAKENGRNRYKFFDPELNRMVVERIRLEGRLRGTLERGELEVYYQPQIDTVTRKIVCAEALVRWRHPEKGVLTPGEFIPFAEESGFIVEIDEWVLKTACVQVKAWMDSGLPPICLTVNFSARQFQRPEMAERVSLILEETGLSPECLDIEITESIAMSNVEDTIARLGELSDIGVSASLDDFGTGYSSLSSLKRLPVRKLKIDRSFINGIASDRDDRAILTAVLLMARTMDLKVVAEGIEREEQFFYLRSLKCDEAQGFLFSEPLPAEEFGELMAAGK